MRAITVRQPHANAILLGEKTIENRGFFTQPGDILICAGKSGEGNGPRGVALCIVRVVGFLYERDDELWLESDEVTDTDNLNLDWYNPGSIGWLLQDIRPVVQVPVRGMPGIFKVDDNLIILR